MKERYNWIRSHKSHHLAELQQDFKSYLSSTNFESDCSAFLEYYLVSYGLNQNDLTIFRENYLAPKLTVLGNVPKKSQLDFLRHLDQYVRTHLNQEIFVRKLFAFVYQKVSRIGFFANLKFSNDQHSALLHLDGNYLQSSGQLLQQALLSSEVVTQCRQSKVKLIGDIEEDEIDIPKLLGNMAAAQGVYWLLLIIITYLALSKNINVIPAVFLLLSLDFIHDYHTKGKFTYLNRNFKETLHVIKGSDKFQFAIKRVIESFLHQTDTYIDSILTDIQEKSSKLQEKTNAYTLFEPTLDKTHAVPLAPVLMTTPIIEGSHPPAPKAPKQLPKLEQLVTSSTAHDDNHETTLTLSWDLGTSRISYKPNQYTEQFVELWTLNRGLKYLNNTYIVFWNSEQIKEAIQAIRNWDFDNVYDEFFVIGQTGHITSYQGNPGYVYCKGQNEDALFKVKSKLDYARYRLYFKPVSQAQTGEILLGDPQFRLDH